MKKILIIALISLFTSQAQAFEDYIITTNGKLTHISIENNQIIDVFPLITVMNEKNTLIVHPLKEGTTNFSIKKNLKEDYTFKVDISNNETRISDNKDFKIISIDKPPTISNFVLDKPPLLKTFNKNINIDGVNIDINTINEEEN